MSAPAHHYRGALPAIVAVALGARLWWVLPIGRPVEWFDFDNYASMASALANGEGGWHWTLDAVRYAEFFKAPLYQVMLSLFTAWPDGFPLSALIAQAGLDSALCVVMFLLGQRLHSRKAGLIAAGIHALWIPAIRSMSFLWQEQLFVPLFTAALVVLAGCLVENRRPRRWAVAGVVFGLAALTRSAVMYYVLPVALVHILLARQRRSWLQSAALVGGFVSVVAPYAIALSIQVGRPVMVEDIGFFQLARTNGGPSSAGVQLDAATTDRAPTLSEVVSYWSRRLWQEPAVFVTERVELVRLLVKPSSGPWLTTAVTATAAGAAMMKWTVHVLLDLPYVVVFVIAPLALALARRSELAVVLAMWPVQYAAMLAMTDWAGARFREPIEPVVIVLAAAVLAGQWRKGRGAALATAVMAAAVIAALVGYSVPAVALVRPNYGVQTGPVGPGPAMIDFDRPFGVNVQSAGQLTLEFSTAGASTLTEPESVRIGLNGIVVDEIRILPGRRARTSYPVPPGMHYLECEIVGPAGPEAPTVRLTVSARLPQP